MNMYMLTCRYTNKSKNFITPVEIINIVNVAFFLIITVNKIMMVLCSVLLARRYSQETSENARYNIHVLY